VLLKNGGMVRGTISELVPDDTVTIVTVLGKTREIKMSDVVYAGPADQAPGGAPPVAAPARATATLRLESEQDGLTFYRASSSAAGVGPGGTAKATGYERLCTVPCRVTLPSGTEVLALSLPGESTHASDPVTFPAGESEVVGRVQSHAGLRAAGWAIGAGSLIAGLVLALATTDGSTDSPFTRPPFIASVVIMGVGMPVGFGMAFVTDKATVEVKDSQPVAMPAARTLALRGNF